ncbi:neural cell adhesion molecule L1-like isoform X1 [Lates japonicus]|uniref:Neural cell adhesion molecule L1-like isoform X1 n=1 Tax=Lates japonicus TaxID=270547 RepID=A0AAD3NLX4_LATJO|nr:neural cell adhesion molecule L1-like isoform X1 [Lates japonicus]
MGLSSCTWGAVEASSGQPEGPGLAHQRHNCTPPFIVSGVGSFSAFEIKFRLSIEVPLELRWMWVFMLVNTTIKMTWAPIDKEAVRDTCLDLRTGSRAHPRPKESEGISGLHVPNWTAIRDRNDPPLEPPSQPNGILVDIYLIPAVVGDDIMQVVTIEDLITASPGDPLDRLIYRFYLRAHCCCWGRRAHHEVGARHTLDEPVQSAQGREAAPWPCPDNSRSTPPVSPPPMAPNSVTILGVPLTPTHHVHGDHQTKQPTP